MRREKGCRARRAAKRLFSGMRDVFTSGEAELAHSGERLVSLSMCAFRGDVRIVARRSVSETSQRRRLSDAQLRRRRAEVQCARGSDADSRLAELDAI